MSMQRKSVLIRILSGVLVIAACGFIFELLAEDWERFVRSISEVDVLLFGISIGLGLLANVIAASFYVFLLQGHHDLSDRRPILGIFLVSQMIRYVPGKVWSYLYQMSLLPAGVTKTATVVTNLEMIMINMIVVGAAGSVAVLWPGYLHVVVLVIALSAAISVGYRQGLADWALNIVIRPFARLGAFSPGRRTYDTAAMTFLISGWVVLVLPR